MAVRIIENRWWVDFTHQGTRYRVRSPANSRAGARAYEVTLQRRLADGEDIRKSRAGDIRPSFKDFADRWFREYFLCNNRPSEQAAKRYILAAALLPFFGPRAIADIGPQMIEQFKAAQQKRGLGNKTINNQLTVLSKCLATAFEWLGIEGSPPRIKRLKCAPARTDYLSEDECARLLAYARDIDFELILTALRTGMRQSEIIGLQWSSIDWQNRLLTVRHSRCKYSKALIPPKSNRERYVPMDDDVYRSCTHDAGATGTSS
jgi:integrase